MRLKSILILLAILLVLGGYFYYSSRPEPTPKPEPQVFVWLVEDAELQRIEIRLPREGKSEAWVKHPDRYWYFEQPGGPKVDMQRWGGGIPLLLSGPGVDRVIAENATETELAKFGLTQPQMEIILTLENEKILNVAVGNSTPDGVNYYVQAPGSNDVALVDFTWYEVLERLVKEPPYTSPSAN